MGSHLWTKDHQLDREDMKTLHLENKGKKLSLLQALEISKAKKDEKVKSVNEQVERKFTPIFQTVWTAIWEVLRKEFFGPNVFKFKSQII